MFTKLICKKLLTVMFIFFAVSGIAFSNQSKDPIQEINESFPGSIRVETGEKRTIEFCPDNTCDFFVATKNVSIESLKDFAYLFLYFFLTFTYLMNGGVVMKLL